MLSYMFQCNSSSSSQTSEGSLPEADQTSRLQRLEHENCELRSKDAQNSAAISKLRTRIGELERHNDSGDIAVTSPPSDELQTMQEELIACKLREAEANLSLKELEQKVIELKQHWQVCDHTTTRRRSKHDHAC